MKVKFEQHVDVHAPVEVVWSVLADPNKWPLWFPDMEQVSNVSAVQSGGTFQWQKGGAAGSGAIVSVEEGREIQVVTQAGGDEVTHIFTTAQSGGLFGVGGHSTRLDYTMEYDPPGGLIGDFIAGGNPKDTLKVKHTLEKIKQLAEGQAG